MTDFARPRNGNSTRSVLGQLRRQSRLRTILAASVLAAAVGGGAWLSGCSVMLGPGGASATLKIGNDTFSISLGSGGVFIVLPDRLVRNILDVKPFSRVPSDTPTSGSVRLRSSSVSVLATGGSGKSMLVAQPSLSGTARLRILMDAPGSESACDTGFEVGTFDVTVQNGVVTRVSDGLPLSLSGASYFYRNDLTLCLEMEADFAGTIRVENLDIVFGPAENLPESQGFRGAFSLVNTSAGPVHILAPRETANEGNRIGSGTHRRTALDSLRVGDLITFRAVREGATLDTVTCPPVLQSGLEPIVEWNGVTMRCYYAVDTGTADTPPATEACCVQAVVGYEEYGEAFRQDCWEIGAPPFRTREDCVFFGAVPQGPGTSCASTTCAEDFRACCLGSHCTELEPARCREIGGDPKSFGVHCSAFPCPPSGGGSPVDMEEACCFDDGTCVDGFPDLCDDLGGLAQGAGTSCASITCPSPPGACCLPDGSCTVLAEDECDDRAGSFRGPSSCVDVECPQPGYVVFNIINYPDPRGRYLTVQLATAAEDPPLLKTFPGGGNDPDEPALLVAENGGLEFETPEAAARSVCSRFTGFCDDPVAVPLGIFDGAESGVDRIFITECAKFQIFQVTNYGSAAYGYLTVRRESQLCVPPLLSGFSGGGIDPVARAEWHPFVPGRYDTAEEAAAVICGRFTSFFRPVLASFIQQGFLDGTRWPEDTVSIDGVFLTACPDVPR